MGGFQRGRLGNQRKFGRVDGKCGVGEWGWVGGGGGGGVGGGICVSIGGVGGGGGGGFLGLAVGRSRSVKVAGGTKNLKTRTQGPNI